MKCPACNKDAVGCSVRDYLCKNAFCRVERFGFKRILDDSARPISASITTPNLKCPGCGRISDIGVLDGGSSLCKNKDCNVHTYHLCKRTGKVETDHGPLECFQ